MEHFVPFEITTCEKADSLARAYPLVPDPHRPFHPFRIQDPRKVAKDLAVMQASPLGSGTRNKRQGRKKYWAGRM